MQLLLGLGNPGKECAQTRHNVGFVFLDTLKEYYKFPEFSYNKKFDADISEGFTNNQEKMILAKPQTFMNNSGKSAQTLINFYKVNPRNLIVITDDLDIEIGKYKISKNISSAGHNGVQNIIDNVGTQDFVRIRIGIETIGGRHKRGQIPGDKFVLQKFSHDECKILKKILQTVITQIKYLKN